MVAARDAGRVVATTVSAFTSLSLSPPSVLVALGPGATVLPFLSPGARCGISILARGQARLASVFADPFPVGPDPFAEDGHPVIPDALVALACVVTETRPGGDHTIIIAAVEDASTNGDEPLVRYRRRYHGIAP